MNMTNGTIEKQSVIRPRKDKHFNGTFRNKSMNSKRKKKSAVSQLQKSNVHLKVDKELYESQIKRLNHVFKHSLRNRVLTPNELHILSMKYKADGHYQVNENLPPFVCLNHNHLTCNCKINQVHNAHQVEGTFNVCDVPHKNSSYPLSMNNETHKLHEVKNNCYNAANFPSTQSNEILNTLADISGEPQTYCLSSISDISSVNIESQSNEELDCNKLLENADIYKSWYYKECHNDSTASMVDNDHCRTVSDLNLPKCNLNDDGGLSLANSVRTYLSTNDSSFTYASCNNVTSAQPNVSVYTASDCDILSGEDALNSSLIHKSK